MSFFHCILLFLNSNWVRFLQVKSIYWAGRNKIPKAVTFWQHDLKGAMHDDRVVVFVYCVLLSFKTVKWVLLFLLFTFWTEACKNGTNRVQCIAVELKQQDAQKYLFCYNKCKSHHSLAFLKVIFLSVKFSFLSFE